jgi:hypothetical protein
MEGLTGRNKQEYQYDKTTVYTSREKMCSHWLVTQPSTLITCGVPRKFMLLDRLCPGKKYILSMDPFPRTEPLRALTMASIVTSP